MSQLKEHRDVTESLIRLRSKDEEGLKKIAEWLLNEGYYPEQYVLPPCFKTINFKLEQDNLVDLESLKKPTKAKEFSSISFPKSFLMPRIFSIIHPKFYHDIVYWLIRSWDQVLDILFNPANNIYSYSFPIPLSSVDKDGISKLRSGRMIYEFLEMAEKDLVAESHQYRQIVKIDITNFYNSVYTHSIAWAWFGDRKKALIERNKLNELGNQLDILFQYSNDARTMGLPVGPAVSDLIVEIILSERDTVITKRLEGIDYVATRFKDDYRFLIKNDDDAKKIIRVVVEVLSEYNLHVNEKKTSVSTLPDGLYRLHALEYEPFSLRKFNSNKADKKIPFKVFEYTLLKILEINKRYPGTSIIEKFLSELTIGRNIYDPEISIEDRLIINFAAENVPEMKRNRIIKTNIKKTINLLLNAKNESPKSLAKVLSIIECICINCEPAYKWLEEERFIKNITEKEICEAIVDESAFDLLWWLYFSMRHDMGIDLSVCLKRMREKKVTDKTMNNLPLLMNPFIACLRGKKPGKGNIDDPFEGKDHSVVLLQPLSECDFLIDCLDIFNREQ